MRFEEKLEVAGLLGLPVSWGPDGKLEFGPEITDARRQAIERLAAEHDWALEATITSKLTEAKMRASSEIAALFGKPPQSLELVFAELNILAEALSLVESTSNPERLTALKQRWSQVKTIRAAENAATQVIEAAKSEVEIP